MKTVCTIEARMRSTRLPGKVLIPILERPMLELMIERLRRVTQIDEIVIATTEDNSCDPIQELAEKVGVGCYRGSEEDVLDRVLKAAGSASADIIVETTGDCPVIDPNIISRVIESFKDSNVDYCSNTLERTYPRGMDVQVFPFKVLKEVSEITDDAADREHVSLYIYEHPERYRLKSVTSNLPPETADWRLTVDTPEDFDLIRQIYENLYLTNPEFDLTDIIELFEKQPNLKDVNRHIQQKSVR